MAQQTTIALASDHAGFELKEALCTYLNSKDFAVLDLGTHSKDSVDYPDFGHRLAQSIASKEAAFGIAICGSGIGISIAANRHAGVRAALCLSPEQAALARAHNDANILALGARFMDENTAIKCTDVFMATDFEGGRHERRIEKLG